MTLLSPWSALLLAAIVVPLLLFLYLLKLRRRTVRLSSTLLWEQSFEDLQANVPFQRLRWSLLLLIQLLIALLLLLAFAEPMLKADVETSDRVILLIDRSGSMNATDMPDGTSRLEAAKQQARTIVQELTRTGRSTDIMVAAFGSSATVISGWSSDSTILLQAIDSIPPTDEEGNLAGALQLAGGFALRAETDTTSGDEPSQPAEVFLLSDGGVGQPERASGFRLPAGRLQYIRIGPDPSTAPPRNVGIATLSAVRDYDDPTAVEVFVRLINTAAEPVEVLISLDAVDPDALPADDIDGEGDGGFERVATAQRSLRAVTVPAASGGGNDGNGAPRSDDHTPGEQSTIFSLNEPGGAVYLVSINRADVLEADDVAGLVLPAPQPPRVLVVHGQTTYPDEPGQRLLNILEVYEPRELHTRTLDQYIAMQENDTPAGRRYDLVVFDRVDSPHLPAVPSITFGGVPAAVDSVPPADERGTRLLSWARRHPIMRHVDLDTVVYRGFGAYELPTGATSLARGPDGPAIALLQMRGARHLMVGFSAFDQAQSNWAFQVSIGVFMLNALDVLTLSSTGREAMVLRPGEVMRVQPQMDAEAIVITTPDGVRQQISVEEQRQTIPLPRLTRAGLYRVTGTNLPSDLLPVSMLSDLESGLATKEQLRVNAELTQAGRGDRRQSRPLWPWLLAAAFVLVVLEWLVYCQKARR